MDVYNILTILGCVFAIVAIGKIFMFPFKKVLKFIFIVIVMDFEWTENGKKCPNFIWKKVENNTNKSYWND